MVWGDGVSWVGSLSDEGEERELSTNGHKWPQMGFWIACLNQ